MKRKKTQKIISSALMVAFLSSSLNILAFGLSPEEKPITYEKILETLKSENAYNFNQKDPSTQISKDIDLKNEDMVSIIVEFISEPLAVLEKGAISTYSLTESNIERDHRIFNSFLSNIPSIYSLGSTKITHSYKKVFNGVALTIKGTDVEKLLDSGVVKAIYKDNIISLDLPVEDETASNNEITPYMTDSIPFLGIDKLHEEGITGKGIKVGVLDTGIDYTHPDLTNVYKGYRSSFGDATAQPIDSTIGWDFIDNDADPMETTYRQWLESGEPEDVNGYIYYTSHGTHVSGTIAGTGENKAADVPVTGVAPSVSLYGYRVLGPRGSGSTSAIIAGIEKSVLDDMDVINLSLGNASINTPYDPMVTAVNNASLAGVVTVIANGNAGPNAGTVSAPGTAQLPIAVGASTVDFTYKNYELTIGENKIKSDLIGKSYTFDLEGLENKDLEVVYCGYGFDYDFDGKDLTGKVALINRGVLTFAEKVKAATNHGAELVIIANNVETGQIPYIGETTDANTLAVTKADGALIKANIDKPLSLKFLTTTTVKGDELADFSSTGPVKRTNEIRPDVIAPGSMIYSTAPEFINDKNEAEEDYSKAYQRMSGTSMAAPHVAGIAALILQENPSYSPDDVKAAMMNTAEVIKQKDTTDYSVNQIGAGRVNPYAAVYEDVSFKANYKTTAGINQSELENITSSLSYGKFFIKEGETVNKTIPISIENNSSASKEYMIQVQYSNSARALNAENNKVKINLPEAVTVTPGEIKSIDAVLTAPYEIEYGFYEGYIKFIEVGNEENIYQMPFSASIVNSGFTTLDYPSSSGNYAKGITAFTSSALFNRNPNTYFGLGDISITVKFNEPANYLHGFVKDYKTGEYIGYAGKQDISWLPDDTEAVIENFVPNGLVKKIVNGKVSYEEVPLPSGMYELEIVAETTYGTTFSKSIPMCIINDAYGDTLTYNFTPGIVEVTDDMYTNEVWYDGLSHEGLWINANVYNEYVNKLKTEGGLSYLKQEEVNSIYANGFSSNGSSTGMGTMSKGDGNILVAGVERTDLENNFFRVELSYANAGKIMNSPKNFIFVKENSPYLSLTSDKTKLSEKSIMHSTIKGNNLKDLASGSFVVQNFGCSTLEIASIKPSAKLKALLLKNKTNINLTYSTSSTDEYEEFKIDFNVTGKVIKGISNDIDLFDITFKVKDIKGVSENLYDDSQFLYTTLSGKYGEFKNSNQEAIEVATGTMHNVIDVEALNRTLIYGVTSLPRPGMSKGAIYALDPSGKKYEPTYVRYAEGWDRGHVFTFNNLPVIKGDYNVVVETPGGLDTVMKVPGSKLNANNKRVGNIFGITSYNFMFSPMYIYMGDVNGDGAIDVVDASEIAKVYEAQSSENINTYETATEELCTDLNQDNAVNRDDMDLLLNNYMMQDLTRKDSKTPEAVVNGKDIYDILESCGYYDEDPYTNVTLNLSSEESLAGEAVELNAIPPTEEVEFQYEFSVKEKNDSQWTIVQERSGERHASWVPEKGGIFEVKVRIFKDDIGYICQDNKPHKVNWQKPEGITLNKEVLNLKVGESFTLEANITPDFAEPQEYIWNSSNENIASVKDGVVTATGIGSALITVENKDRSFNATCTVNVTEAMVPLASIKLDKSYVILFSGKETDLNVTFNPTNASNKNITWTTSDEAIAKVKDGKITALSAGKAIITATSEDGTLTDTCIVRVLRRITSFYSD